jgi:N-acetylmuramoyl-L-alanine amidase
VNSLLEKDNRRSSARISEDIYIMKNINCPAVLVECGFISNPTELARLTDNGYQRKLSLIITGSVLQCFGGLEEHYGKD